MRLFAIYFTFVLALAVVFTQSRTTTSGEALGIALIVLAGLAAFYAAQRCLSDEDSGVEHDGHTDR